MPRTHVTIRRLLEMLDGFDPECRVRANGARDLEIVTPDGDWNAGLVDMWEGRTIRFTPLSGDDWTRDWSETRRVFAALGIPGQQTNALLRGGFRNVEQVAAATDDELMRSTDGLARKGVQNIRKAIPHDASLRMSVDGMGGRPGLPPHVAGMQEAFMRGHAPAGVYTGVYINMHGDRLLYRRQVGETLGTLYHQDLEWAALKVRFGTGLLGMRTVEVWRADGGNPVIVSGEERDFLELCEHTARRLFREGDPPEMGDGDDDAAG